MNKINSNDNALCIHDYGQRDASLPGEALHNLYHVLSCIHERAAMSLLRFIATCFHLSEGIKYIPLRSLKVSAYANFGFIDVTHVSVVFI